MSRKFKFFFPNASSNAEIDDPHDYDILFFKDSWERIAAKSGDEWDADFVKILSAAADRWNSCIRLNPRMIRGMNTFVTEYKSREQIDEFGFRLYKGIILDKLTILPDNSNFIVLMQPLADARGQFNLIDDDRVFTYIHPLRFRLSINKFKFDELDSQQKLNLLTHALGHALGFGRLKDFPATKVAKEYNKAIRMLPADILDKMPNKDIFIDDKNTIIPLQLNNWGPNAVNINNKFYPGLSLTLASIQEFAASSPEERLKFGNRKPKVEIMSNFINIPIITDAATGQPLSNPVIISPITLTYLEEYSYIRQTSNKYVRVPPILPNGEGYPSLNFRFASGKLPKEYE